MDKDQVTGSAQKLGGSAKEAFGDVLGYVKLRVGGKADQATGMVRHAVSRAKDDARDWSDDAQGELAHVRGEVDRLTEESIAPVLSSAAVTVEEYARQARDVITARSEQASTVIRERPLIAIGLATTVGYLVSRLSSSTTYVYRRR